MATEESLLEKKKNNNNKKEPGVCIYIKRWKCILEQLVIKPYKGIQRDQKMGHRIMAKYFTNNCLLSAANLHCPAGLSEEKDHTSETRDGDGALAEHF